MPKFKVCDINEIEEGKIITKLTPYGPVGITKINGDIIAFQDECTHDGSAFENAKLDSSTYEIICPRHGGRFDLKSGRATKLPATEAIDIYKIDMQENEVYINID